jgi:GT2 family glycosyltransferase
MPTPRATLVTPLFNKVDYTQACMTAVSENTGMDDYQVVLIDNGSTDGTGRFLDCLEGDVDIIRNEVNLGFAVASNQGAALARSEVIVFLNNDTEPFPGWLDPLLRVLEERPEVAAVGSRLLFPDGLIQHAGVAIVEELMTTEGRVSHHRFGGVHAHYRLAADDPHVLVPRDWQAVTGACMAVRRDAFEAVGGFDEGYWNGNEDVDLCFAFGARGQRVAYEPSSVLIHHESVSGPERFSKVPQNEDRLRDKWLERVVPDFIVDERGLRPHPARASREARRSWRRDTTRRLQVQRAATAS